MTTRIFLFLLALSLLLAGGCQPRDAAISGEATRIAWQHTDQGWKIASVEVKAGSQWKQAGVGSGEHTLLFSAEEPDSALSVFKTTKGRVFPGAEYHYQKKAWEEATHPVTLNTAGKAIHFFPAEAEFSANKAVTKQDLQEATIISEWTIDSDFPTDILVHQTLIAKKDGYYSLASPTLATVPEQEMAWATVPGYFQSNAFADNFVSGYAYGHGVPKSPVLYRERSISTLTSIVDTKSGVSLSVIPEPGLARDPWTHDRKTHEEWSVGISHMNRRAELTPTLYYPVLGEPGSKLKAGDTVQYKFRFSIREGDWYENLRHAIYDVYDFREGLALRSNKQSLSDRIRRMRHYLTDPKTSMWNIELYDGMTIGAQSYKGGVVGSQGDAMKNADYGAMWMLTRATGDQILRRQVLPYALNFKLKQQETGPGFFQGAAVGQYYLARRKKFVEEWGEFIEPISLTYYTMLDIGNMLLFEPENDLLKRRLRLGADLLLRWQKPDGSWEVAYDRETHQPLFEDIQDLRPTFYGLLVAYRILKDEKYLEGARRGADWLIANGVNKGHFIGVCGDARYAPDFATGQTAQALLDLSGLTGDAGYRNAAVAAARIYTTSIYTHPVATRRQKRVKGVLREDWEIAQAGLSFEHGGMMGSAQRHGPIQLASHAGMFVRMFDLTGDSLFIDMARAAAIGRDAFVDSATSVASYYWEAMNRGAGPYPHHAWWQIGWITDYLMAEAELRSQGSVIFPRGFVTPKVGPHQTYGFEAGMIYGEAANLIIRDGLVIVPDPNIEFITAQSTSEDRLYVILMNAVNQTLRSRITVDPKKIRSDASIQTVHRKDIEASISNNDQLNVELAPYGMAVYAIDFR